MTRVDVSGVHVVCRGDGAPVFAADTMSYAVSGGDLWFSMRGPDGEAFAVAKIPRERAAAALAQMMIELGATIKESSNGKN